MVGIWVAKADPDRCILMDSAAFSFQKVSSYALRIPGASVFEIQSPLITRKTSIFSSFGHLTGSLQHKKVTGKIHVGQFYLNRFRKRW